jgi:hypothetical protein
MARAHRTATSLCGSSDFDQAHVKRPFILHASGASPKPGDGVGAHLLHAVVNLVPVPAVHGERVRAGPELPALDAVLQDQRASPGKSGRRKPFQD